MAARKEAPQSAKVTVYDAVTGAALERWPVDAKELVASGAATFDPPVADAAPAEPRMPEPEPVADAAPAEEPKKRGR
ncbi:MAG: hypothetical protein ACK6CY_09005 [Gemmatimonadota bacterium]|jgi:hypothetical protein